MPNYDYKCDCGHVQERRFSMKDRPESVSCSECSGTAQVQFSAGFTSFVKGRDWDWHGQRNKGLCIPNTGRAVRSTAAQGRLHDQMIGEARNKAKADRRSMSKKDVQWEHIGKTPIEVHEGVVEATGDKEIWQKDTVNLLKRTGCYLGDD